MIRFAGKQAAYALSTMLVWGLLCVPLRGLAQTTNSNGGTPSGSSAPDRGLTLQPTTPPGNGSTAGGTPLGGLVPTAPSTSTPPASTPPASTQPALTPMQQLQAVVNTPGVTANQIVVAVDHYWYLSGPNAPVPLITPTGDTSYRAAYKALQAQINQTLPPTDFESVVKAIGAAAEMSPGANRTAALNAAQQLNNAQSQRDADYVFYQEAVTAAQLLADGHPGAAVAIAQGSGSYILIAGPDTAAYIARLKANYEASQAALDAVWTNLGNLGISQADMIKAAASSSNSFGAADEQPGQAASSADIAAAMAEYNIAVQALSNDQVARANALSNIAAGGTIGASAQSAAPIAQPMSAADLAATTAEYNAAVQVLTNNVAALNQMAQAAINGQVPPAGNGSTTPAPSKAEIATAVNAYSTAAQAILDDLAAGSRVMQGIAGGGMLPGSTDAAAALATAKQNQAAAEAIASDVAAQQQAVQDAMNSLPLVEAPGSPTNGLGAVPVNVTALSAQLQALEAASASDASGGMQVAQGATIYKGYRIIPGQGGSSVIVVPSLQLSVPSSVMTSPGSQVLVASTQVQTPTSVMTSLNLQPALCGR